MSLLPEQLARHEAELDRIQEVIDELFTKGGARIVLLLDKSGRPIASRSAGDGPSGNRKGPPAVRFDRPDEVEMLRDVRLVAGRAILVSILPVNAPRKALDLAALEAIDALCPLLDDVHRREALHGLDALFPEVTQQDVDRLFAD